jgi:hypothetical protein
MEVMPIRLLISFFILLRFDCMGYSLDNVAVWRLATCCTTKSRSSSTGGGKNFLFTTWCIPVVWSTQSPMQWVRGTAPSGIKRQGREADHSPLASVEVKKRGSIRPLSLTPSWRSD